MTVKIVFDLPQNYKKGWGQEYSVYRVAKKSWWSYLTTYYYCTN